MHAILRRALCVLAVFVWSVLLSGPAAEAANQRGRTKGPTASVRRKKVTPLQQKLSDVVRRHVARVSKKNFGIYPLEDGEWSESWMTELLKIDMGKVRRVFEDEYILRGVFRELPMDAGEEGYAPKKEGGVVPKKEDGAAPKKEDGAAPKEIDIAGLKKIIVDFTVVRDRKGRWRVKEEAIFSVDGIQFFSYTDTHERVRLERESRVSTLSFEDDGEEKPETGKKVEDVFAAPEDGEKKELAPEGYQLDPDRSNPDHDDPVGGSEYKPKAGHNDPVGED